MFFHHNLLQDPSSNDDNNNDISADDMGDDLHTPHHEHGGLHMGGHVSSNHDPMLPEHYDNLLDFANREQSLSGNIPHPSTTITRFGYTDNSGHTGKHLDNNGNAGDHLDNNGNAGNKIDNNGNAGNKIDNNGHVSN